MTGKECKAVLSCVHPFCIITTRYVAFIALWQNQTLWIKRHALIQFLFRKFKSQSRKIVTVNFLKLRNLAQAVKALVKSVFSP